MTLINRLSAELQRVRARWSYLRRLRVLHLRVPGEKVAPSQSYYHVITDLLESVIFVPSRSATVETAELAVGILQLCRLATVWRVFRDTEETQKRQERGDTKR